MNTVVLFIQGGGEGAHAEDALLPFAHLALHGARIPQAVVRPVDSGGHQFDNDLTLIAEDIRADAA